MTMTKQMKIYLVGGAVRDRLLDIPCKDRDYVITGATHAWMIDNGFDHIDASSFPVYMKNGEEYALARRERKTGEGYMGFECEFGPDVTVEQDLARRDLSINSIAYDEQNDIYYDPFNGRGDLEKKILRHTSSAFSEDPLRVIRLARFYARYPEFTIAPETILLAWDVVASGEMDKLSMERYWAELRKVMVDSPDQLGRFLNALTKMRAAGGAFFRDVLGTQADSDFTVTDVVYGHAIAKIVDPDLAVAMFVTLYGSEHAPLAHAAVPVRVKTLVSNFNFVLNWTGTNSPNAPATRAEMLHDILERTRSLNGGSMQLFDLCKCLEATLTMKEYAAQLKSAVWVTSVINAEPFMHLKGKAIGAALKAARIKAIMEMEQ